jgi:hypothetical protein
MLSNRPRTRWLSLLLGVALWIYTPSVRGQTHSLRGEGPRQVVVGPSGDNDKQGEFPNLLEPQSVLDGLGGLPEVVWDKFTNPSDFFNEVGRRATLSLELRKRWYSSPADVLNPTCGSLAISDRLGLACPGMRVLEQCECVLWEVCSVGKGPDSDGCRPGL